MNTEPQKHNPLLPWIMWLLGALFYAYEFFLQVSPSVMADDLMKAFHVTAAAIGNFGGLYFYAYMIMQIPVGILLDRFGPRRLLTAASSLCAIGALLFAVAQAFSMVGFGRFLIGLGSASAAISCLYIAATWLPAKRFALLTGLLLSIGMLGAVSGEAPLALIVEHVTWRHTMLILAGVGGVLAILIWTVIRDHPLASADAKQHRFFDAHFLSGIRYILKSKPAWLISIYAGLMYTPTLTFGSLWGVPFLMQLDHLTRPLAASLVSMLYVGWIFGAPLFGWLSDFIGRRRPPLITASIGTFISVSCVIYIPHLPVWLMGTLLFFFGFFSSAFLPAFSVIKENTPPERHGVAMGFMNSLNTLGTVIAQPLIGLALDHFWQGKMEAGVRVYTLANYHATLFVLPLCALLSLFLIPLIQETYCKSLIAIESEDA